MQDAPDELLTPKQMASMLKISMKTLRRWIAAGTMPPAYCVGGTRRWRRKHVDDWLSKSAGPDVGNAGSSGPDKDK